MSKELKIAVIILIKKNTMKSQQRKKRSQMSMPGKKTYADSKVQKDKRTRSNLTFKSTFSILKGSHRAIIQ